MRKNNTNREGKGFSERTVQQVWDKAKQIPHGNNKDLRLDQCGTFISRSEYGKESNTGWEIDHIRPVAKGGSDDLSNLQPLQWENNRAKGDNFPEWECKKGTGSRFSR